MKPALSETQTDGEDVFPAMAWLHSAPVRPSIDGLIDLFIHPRTWSKDLFSRTRITMFLIGVFFV